MSIRIVTATPSLEASTAWFETLGFERVGESPPLYADGGAVVEIDPARTARPGIKIFRSEWGETAAALAEFGPLHEFDGGRLIAAPSGTWVYLMNGEAASPDPAPASAMGSFAGISLETTRMPDSARFWGRLGFEVAAGGPEQGWLSLTGDGGFGVSLMKPFACPHTFVNPSLTYFNSGKNPAVIAELRRRGVKIYEEITAFNPNGEVDNVILREPGGLGFFVFND